MKKEHEQAINNLQRLRKVYIDGRTSFELKKKSVEDNIVSYNIAIQTIRDLDKMQNMFDKIRKEIEELSKTYPFINHIDSYVKEDDILQIIDKYKSERSK